MSKMRSPFGVPVKCTGGYPTYNSSPAPSTNSSNPHEGEDYIPQDKNVESNWNLYTPCDGTVYISKKQTGSYSGGFGAWGYYAVIIADDGRWVLMAHMKNMPLVKAGQRVVAGQQIGVAGNTGNSKGRHLHIEVADMKGVSYNGANWYQLERERRMRPSDHIDFGNTATASAQEGFEMKTWTNGSTKELVYQTTTDCKSNKNSIGSLDPRESCDCYGIVDGCYLVSYKVGGTNSRKCGFVAYAGGVK